VSNSRRRRIIGKLLGELMVIVVGVLVALQVDRLRVSSDSATREAAQLQALQADLTATHDRLSATVLRQRRTVESGRALLRVMDEGAQVPADSVVQLFTYASVWYGVQPVTGAYDALISSGDIGLIGNPDLRRRLAELSGDLAAGFEDHENLMVLLAALQRETAVWFPELHSGFRRTLGLSPAEPGDAVAALLSSREVKGVLFIKTRFEMERLARQIRLVETVENLLGTIDHELGRR
jgi:hypothetical protein